MKFKAVDSHSPDNITTQLPQESGPVNPKSQQPPTSQNNLPLEDAPVHAGNPWPRAGKMSGNLFEIRKDWQKQNPKTLTSQYPVQLQQSQRDVDGD